MQINLRPRGVAAAAAATALLACLGACGSSNGSGDDASGDGLPTVRMNGVVNDPGGVIPLAVKTLGLDKKNGFHLKYSMGDPTGGTTPFLMGQVELEDGDAVNAAIANNAGHDTVAFYPFMSQTASVVVSGKSGITSVQGLIGKRIGYFGSDSGTFQAIDLTLRDGYGINLAKQATLVQSDPEVLPELLRKGDVDAILDFEPFGDRAIQEANGTRLFGVTPYAQKKWNWTPPLAMLWANRSWVSKNPELAADVQKAFAAAEQKFIDSKYELLKEEPYAKFLQPKDQGELDRLVTYCQQLPCYTNQWSEHDSDRMNEWIAQMASYGILDKVPSTPGSATLASLVKDE